MKLKQSIYLRVPNDIADLIGIESDAEITLHIKEQDKQFLLIYSVSKSHVAATLGSLSPLQMFETSSKDNADPRVTCGRHVGLEGVEGEYR